MIILLIVAAVMSCVCPTCQETAPSMTVDSRLKNTSRSEMRQKCRMPLEAMTWSRLRLLDRWARQAFWHSLNLVWKPQIVISRIMWQMDQKRPNRQKPGMTKYHNSRWPSYEDKKTVIKQSLKYVCYIFLGLIILRNNEFEEPFSSLLISDTTIFAK